MRRCYRAPQCLCGPRTKPRALLKQVSTAFAREGTVASANVKARWLVMALILSVTSACSTSPTHVATTPEELREEAAVVIAAARTRIAPGSPTRSVCVNPNLFLSQSFEPSEELAEVARNFQFRTSRPEDSRARTIRSFDLMGLQNAGLRSDCRSSEGISASRVQFAENTAFVLIGASGACGHSDRLIQMQRREHGWSVARELVLGSRSTYSCPNPHATRMLADTIEVRIS
jgi:hypothetical protein